MEKRKAKKNTVARFETVDMKLSDLRDHPRNYRQHTDDQLMHIKASLTESGVYRNVVVAEDGTILAGHGVIKAANQLKMETFPVIRLPIEWDSAAALKVLTGDNEIARMAMQDDRALTELLKTVMEKTSVEGLLGTGFDDKMLAALTMVSRPKSEIADLNEAAEWTGMPEFPDFDEPIKVSVSFESEEHRAAFFEKLDVTDKVTPKTKAMWYPWKERRDISSVRYEDQEAIDE